MMPSIIFETLSASSDLSNLGVDDSRILESQSVDERPFGDGYFITISFEEIVMSGVSKLAKGPRVCTIAVHHPWDEDRDFLPINSILNKIDELLLPLEDVAGSDGIRVTSIRRQGRSSNLVDEGWKTITRTSTYGVLYNEFDA